MEYRNKGRHTFINAAVINAAGDTETSLGFNIEPYSKMLIKVQITMTLNPADATVQVIPQFSDDNVEWYDYMSGPFGLLLYEEDMFTAAVPYYDAQSGDAIDKFMRIKIVGAGVALDATNFFTVSVKGTFLPKGG